MYRFTTAFLKTLGAILNYPSCIFQVYIFCSIIRTGISPIDCTSFHLDVGCCVEEESIRFPFRKPSPSHGRLSYTPPSKVVRLWRFTSTWSK